MNWVAGIVVFLLIWWLVLFAVLPWGVRAQYEDDNVAPGSEPAAPVNPKLWHRVGATTLITAVLWALVFALVESGWISLRPETWS